MVSIIKFKKGIHEEETEKTNQSSRTHGQERFDGGSPDPEAIESRTS
jgi:hypothetical protein